jgi:PKD repeat protein
MGTSFYAGVTQWSKGEYTQASNRQDDLTIIAANGIALLPDDVGNTMTTARSLPGSKATFTGIIHNAADIDIFQITTGAGSITLSADPGGPQATNLDTRISLYDGSGTLLTHANPTGLATTLTTVVNAGTYYVAVEGVGLADANTGYTDYASIGAYTLTTTLVATTNQAPLAVMTSNVRSGYGPLTVTFSSIGSTDKDGSITRYAWNFGDSTPLDNTPNPSHTYTKTGSYLATLTLWDNAGFSTIKTLTISVQTEPVKLSVSSITLTSALNTSGAKVITAQVIVVNTKGQIVSGATVRGTWSGALTGTVSGTTNATGASLSIVNNSNTGIGVFTVTSLSMSGAIYNKVANVEATKSITL